MNMTTRKLCLFAAVLASYVVAGCVQPAFDSFLPTVWPDGLETVYKNPANFTAPTSGEIVSGRPGDFLDPLGDIVGCWGGYTSDWIGSTEGFPTDLYQSIVFLADGTFQRSALNAIPGQIAVVFVQEGRYSIEPPNKINLFETAFYVYSPQTKTYTPFTEGGTGGTQVLLATRDGNLLRLEDEVPVQDSQPIAYTPILRRFNCGD